MRILHLPRNRVLGYGSAGASWALHPNGLVPGRSSRWCDDHPGSRVTPWQGEGPQPSARESKRGRVALGRHTKRNRGCPQPSGMLTGESRMR